MCDLASTPLFTVAVISPSSSDNAIKTVQRAYRTVFGKQMFPPGTDETISWFGHGVVEELWQILPSLPNLNWENVPKLTPDYAHKSAVGTQCPKISHEFLGSFSPPLPYLSRHSGKFGAMTPEMSFSRLLEA
ncbi:uncharacterized protein BT62DRAFT_1000809 [Guyanagaster necrorhizus]|uniref:Uncharacterized protein n=1 Tax=Guyanagaster necrorhizus TaxID=856835 RepID=A0A9P7W2U5_9AGAR|nr:uncharacterized protein BT62DRAFT_1000809 [Guyanagaster necrorhizus MCA 3950]KAG7451554.1 hypothetical protein BT62DRAFT_1000809 [Guyanagaster necrorhizus MCA 3950]